MNLSDFLDMGGYAEFVWPSYLVAAVILLALLVLSISALRSSEKTLKLLQETRQPRRARRQAGRDVVATAAKVGEG